MVKLHKVVISYAYFFSYKKKSWLTQPARHCSECKVQQDEITRAFCIFTKEVYCLLKIPQLKDDDKMLQP